MGAVVVQCLSAFACTLALTALYRRFAADLGLIATVNARSAHDAPTPTGAGVAFVAIWLISLLIIPAEVGILAIIGWLLAAVIGFLDDRSDLPVLPRAGAYLVASVCCVAVSGFPVLNLGGFELDAGGFGLAFGGVALMWLLNLYNFMDGIDGIAIGEAIFVLIGVMVVAGEVSLPLVMLASCCAGFAVLNWPRASVFMGDVGASFLGLALGTFALMEVGGSVWVWVILLGYFLTDASLTLTVRLIRGDRVHEAHSLHAYQHLSRRFGAARVLYGVLAVDVFWLLPVAGLAHRTPEIAVYLVIFAFIPLLVCQFLCGAGQLEPKLGFIRSRGRSETSL